MRKRAATRSGTVLRGLFAPAGGRKPARKTKIDRFDNGRFLGHFGQDFRVLAKCWDLRLLGPGDFRPIFF